MKLKDILNDPDLEKLLRPLCKVERNALVESLKRHEVIEPLIIWAGQGKLVDGYHRRQIARELHGDEIDVPVVNMEFADKNAVIEFMLRKQLGRRNLTAAERTHIALQLSELTRAEAKENQRAGGKGLANLPKVNTRAAVADMAQVSERNVGKVKKVIESNNEEIKSAMLAGETTIHAAYEAVSPPKPKRKPKAADAPRPADEQSPVDPQCGEPRLYEPTPANAAHPIHPVDFGNMSAKGIAQAETVLVSAKAQASTPEAASHADQLANSSKIPKATNAMFPATQLFAVAQPPRETSHEVPPKSTDMVKSRLPYKFAPFSAQHFDPSRDSDRALEPGCREAVANAMFREVGQRYLCLLDGVERLTEMVHASAPRTLTTIDEDRERLCRSTESVGQDLLQLIQKWKSRG